MYTLFLTPETVDLLGDKTAASFIRGLRVYSGQPLPVLVIYIV